VPLAVGDTLAPAKVRDAVPVALLASVYVPVAVRGHCVVVPRFPPGGEEAPVMFPEVMFPFPSKTNVPMKGTGDETAPFDPVIMVIVYVPVKLALE
jgi:hypothetical protein